MKRFTSLVVATMAAAAAAVPAASPATASAHPNGAAGVESTQCWVSNVGRNEEPEPDGSVTWPIDPAAAVRLQSCLYSDGVDMWAKTELIGRADTVMYGAVQVSLQRCSDGNLLTTGRMTWDGNGDGYGHLDHGTQLYGGTYFINVWTSKVRRVPGMRVRLKMRIGGAVWTHTHGGRPDWALASNGPDGVTPPNENWFAPSDSNPQPQKCVTL